MTRRPRSVPALLLSATFISGVAALVYEIVWLGVLSTIVGSTAIAAAATLAAFFAGLALGAYLAGKRAAALKSPLLACAVVELGIAAWAALFVGSIAPAGEVSRWLYAWLGHGSVLVVAVSLLVPPSALMGATIPLVGEVLVREPDKIGRGASAIYAFNTLGAATGAAAAGFWLVPELGPFGACGVAGGLNLVAALVLVWVHRAAGLARGRGDETRPTQTSSPEAEEGGPPRGARWVPLSLAGLSGLLALSLEVLWTRMLEQVVHNSVYTFGAILIVFLVALGLASALVHAAMRLARLRRSVQSVASGAALFASVATATSAWVFLRMTGGFQSVEATGGFGGYVGALLELCVAVFFLAALVAGMLFPLSIEMASRNDDGPGQTIGRLGAVNTAGAIAGSLLGGFVLTAAPLGLWRSLGAITLAYGLVAAAILPAGGLRSAVMRGLCVVVGVGGAWVVVDLPPPIALRNRERVLELVESPDGIVATTVRHGNRRLKVNNHYTLGSTRTAPHDRLQAHIPLLLHPAPKEAFFLGLGTGITANAALEHDVSSVTVVELTPAVIDHSERFFASHVGALLTDSRVRVVEGDARHHLATHGGRYDVIIGDLFVPWRAGVGNLYSQEHFEVVRSRLSPTGLFAQWLPLYQLSRTELDVIVRTMLEVFEDVTLWRGDFQARRPAIAVVGHAQDFELTADVERRVEALARDQRLPPWMRKGGFVELYLGHPSCADELFSPAPINRDGRPVIAYTAPKTQRDVRSGLARFVTFETLEGFMGELVAACPIESDPALRRLDSQRKDRIRAGALYHHGRILLHRGDERGRRLFERYDELVGHPPVREGR